MNRRVLLLQLDGKLPNIALMRIAAHHRNEGDDIQFQVAGNARAVEKGLFDDYDKVYASAIFERSRALTEHLKVSWPDAVIGGTGWDIPPLQISSIESLGMHALTQDYGIYPKFPHSIGFSQRGCRLKCSFCVVPQKEGRVKEEQAIHQIWRGHPWPKNILLLDNDFFGQTDWRGRIAEIRDGNFKVCFSQGINARCLTDEAAEAIASIRYYDDDFKDRRIYTAWDNRADEERLFNGLNALARYGVRPDNIMVYMLVGYWPGETIEDCLYRHRKLREFGARPYPMPYTRTPELVGFQRWIVRRCDMKCSWDEFVRAEYRPERVGLEAA